MDFLGSTTPAELTASVANSVQTTGADIWPLVALVGIPLAFVIAAYVISLIKHAAGRRKGA